MMDGSDFGLQELLLMLKGAGVTLSITFWAVLGGTLMGLVFGLVRSVAPWWINWPLGGLLDVFRSVPLLIQLVLVNSFKSIIGLMLPKILRMRRELLVRAIVGTSLDLVAMGIPALDGTSAMPRPAK